MSEEQSDIRQAVREAALQFFADRVTREALDATEAGLFAAELWNDAAGLGLTTAALAEENGGLGSLRDACILLRPAGYHAVPLPLAEALVAGWLLERAGVALPEGVMTFAPGPVALEQTAGRVLASATVTAVPWGRDAAMLVTTAVLDGRPQLVLLPLAGGGVTRARNLAGEPRDTLTFDKAEATVAPLPVGQEEILVTLAAMRAAQMAGAMERILDLAVTYAGERQQFGRPIGKFQAIQQQLAILANHVAASIMAADRAIAAIGTDALSTLGAIAKVRAGEGASEGVRIAHQVHGAMGFTHEHVLHHLTRRLWSWRDEHGAESVWARRLGAAALAGGADNLWTLVGEAA